MIRYRTRYLVDHPGGVPLVLIGLVNGVMLGRGEWVDIGLSMMNFAATAVLIVETIRRLSQR